MLVELLFDPEFTEAGLFLGQLKERRSWRGVVAAVGPGRRLDNGEYAAPELRIGDHVAFPHHAGTDLKSGDFFYRLMPASDILGVFEE